MNNYFVPGIVIALLSFSQLALADSRCESLLSKVPFSTQIVGKIKGIDGLAFSIDKSNVLRILKLDGQSVDEFPYGQYLEKPTQVTVEWDQKHEMYIVTHRGLFASNHVSIWQPGSATPVFDLKLGDTENVSTHLMGNTVLMRNYLSFYEEYTYYIADLKNPKDVYVVDHLKSGESLRGPEVSFIAIDKDTRTLVQGFTDGSYQVRSITKNTIISQGKIEGQFAKLKADYSKNKALLTDNQGTKEIGRFDGWFTHLKNMLRGSPENALATTNQTPAVIQGDRFGNLTIVNEGEGWNIINLKASQYPWIKTHGFHRQDIGNYDKVLKAPGRVLARTQDGYLIAVEGANDTITNRFMVPPVDIEIYASHEEGPKLVQTIKHEDLQASSISIVEFTHDNKNILIAGGNSKVQLWSVESGRKIADVSTSIPSAVRISPSKTYVLSFYQPKWNRHSPFTDIEVYDTATGTFVTRLKTFTDQFADAKFLTDHSILALESDGQAVIFDIDPMKTIRDGYQGLRIGN
jgi:WD40 repeat protein